MRRRYDHIDLRVRSLAEARPFYETLLPALGFTRDVRIEHWLQFEAAGADSVTEFFGVTESSRHVANECRIAFWADSQSEVDRLAEIMRKKGCQKPFRRAQRPTRWPSIHDASFVNLLFAPAPRHRLACFFHVLSIA